MRTMDDLARTLARIDGRGYKAYKDIRGDYELDRMSLHIDHVQGDPFASPSKVRIRVASESACFPPELFENAVRRVALEDFLSRQVAMAIRDSVQGIRGTGKSGMARIDSGGQEVLERTALVVTPKWVEARLQVGLPAAGRRVLGRQAQEMLCRELPRVAERGLRWVNTGRDEALDFVECIENQEHIRDRLGEMGLVAFVADLSILPRESGASDRPLRGEAAVPFAAPDPLRVNIEVPNPVAGGDGRNNVLSGLGIPAGVTLIVGGGYHGKSTLLRALERGVYPHIPGDGREYVVTSRDAVKVRAEDGRRVEKVDIDAFIGDLPYGRSTAAFSTDDASGSTSMAANIIEALEVGAGVLLLDEDTSATNFMVRDARMQALVRRDQEPITPFLDRVGELNESLGVSTVLVMGGCGDYFDVADTVIRMSDYLPQDATEEAKRVASSLETQRRRETSSPMSGITARIPEAESFDPSRGKRDVKIDAKAKDLILFGSDPIELRGVEQLVDISQTRAVGHAIHMACVNFMDGSRTLAEVVDRVEALLDENGLDCLDPFRRGENHPGDFARPRGYEVAAAINRLRTVRMRQGR